MEDKVWDEPFNKIRWGQAVNTVLHRHEWSEDTFALVLARYDQLEQLERRAEKQINQRRADLVKDIKKTAGVLEL